MKAEELWGGGSEAGEWKSGSRKGRVGRIWQRYWISRQLKGFSVRAKGKKNVEWGF